ncbi:DUF5667 domain-containing protein [Desulfosporosinus sp. FKA]|uniref:DUF5667 domain-containing protein n=1 Tax=Desulfosporosinus sp. FKA TaxID=1969834 RepID=UPI000B4991FD|nr:DUF5667 domain-containing protein [Desulfosporosinus sp. FKA]
MNKMQHMKRKIAIAATFTLLTLPVGSALTLADTVSSAASATNATATTATTTATAANTNSDSNTVVPPLDPTVPVTVSPATVVDGNGNTVTAENWFTDLLGKIQLMLTSDPVNKASINEHHALANLAEAKKLMQQGNSQAAEACLSQYSDKISQAENFINQAKDPNSQTAKALTIALANVNSNNIEVLSSLLDKLPPQAAQRLALNIVKTMEKAVTKLPAEGTDSTAGTTSSTSSSTNSSTTVPSGTSASTSGSVTDSGSVTANSNPTNTQPVTNNTKQLEKDAKAALENFKKSLKQNVKLNLDDQDQDEDNSGTQQVTPARHTPMTQGAMMSGPKTGSNFVHPSVKGSPNSEHGNGPKSKSQGREDHQRD